MITFRNLTPRAIEAVVEGRVTAEDTRDALERIDALIAAAPKIDILTDVREGVHIDLAAIGEELKHLPAIRRMMGALERVALVADPAWVRGIGRVEALVIPGIDYRVFKRPETAIARSWILREDER